MSQLTWCESGSAGLRASALAGVAVQTRSEATRVGAGHLRARIVGRFAVDLSEQEPPRFWYDGTTNFAVLCRQPPRIRANNGELSRMRIRQVAGMQEQVRTQPNWASIACKRASGRQFNPDRRLNPTRGIRAGRGASEAERQCEFPCRGHILATLSAGGRSGCRRQARVGRRAEREEARPADRGVRWEVVDGRS